MAIKRYIANKDNTITNAFKENLSTGATDSNMGASDILEVFSIYGQASTSSVEKARSILEFDVSQISADRAAGNLPASGSVKFVLRLSNAEHSSTVPSGFTLSTHAISSSWSEGIGLDMETYKDTGASNWVSRSADTLWSTPGGDILEGAYFKDKVFDSGLEDLEVDISNIVEDWLDSTISNNGLLVKLSGSSEDGTLERSYYTKRFFARGSQYFFKRPVIEARWDSSTKDDRGSAIKSSSLAPAADNINQIYFYNKIRGQMKDIPGIIEQPIITGSHLLVQFFSASSPTAETVVGPALNLANSSSPSISHTTASTTYIAAKRVSTGLYKAEFAYSGDSTQLKDVWTSRNILGSATFDLSQETAGTSGETAVDLSAVMNITSSTPTFTGSLAFKEVTIKVTGLPANSNSFTLTDNESPAVSSGFIFKTNSDVFNDTGNLSGGKMIIGIQSATSPLDVAVRMKTAITTKLGIEGGTDGGPKLDVETDIYTQLYTGSLFGIHPSLDKNYKETPQYVTNITNLKPSYKKDEQVIFRVFTKDKNIKPNIYTVASKQAQVTNIRDGYYKVRRVVDDLTVIDYSTGSAPYYSSLSYDVSGSYFDLDMSILEPNYLYEIGFLYKDGLNYIEQKEKFKFRVDP